MQKDNFLSGVDTKTFYPIVSILGVVVLVGIFFEQFFINCSKVVVDFCLGQFTWFYLPVSGAIIIATYVFACTPFASRVVGGDKYKKPVVGIYSYLAVIITGSIGSGILFWGVAEPLYHYYSPPILFGNAALSPAAASAAIGFATTHWAYVFFACIALWSVGIGYMCFERGLPFRPSSALYPLLKLYTFKWPGRVVDIVCVVSLIGGIVTSFGFGAMQMAGGVEYVFGIKPSNMVYFWIVVLISAAFTCSSIRGIKKGITVLADLNGYFYIALFLFLFIAGPTKFLIGLYVEAVGDMFVNFVPMMTNVDPFGVDKGWSTNWSALFFVWACVYTPVTSMFFVTISRGRTYRQMMLLSLIPPTLWVLVMFAALGGNAIWLDAFADAKMMDLVNKVGVPMSVYYLLERFPLGSIGGITLLFTLLISFTTMTDNMTFSIASLTSKAVDENEKGADVHLRFFWAVVICALTLVCLFVLGNAGTKALESMSAACGLPFYVLMVLLIIAIAKMLSGKYDTLEYKENSGIANE